MNVLITAIAVNWRLAICDIKGQGRGRASDSTYLSGHSSDCFKTFQIVSVARGTAGLSSPCSSRISDHVRSSGITCGHLRDVSATWKADISNNLANFNQDGIPKPSITLALCNKL